MRGQAPSCDNRHKLGFEHPINFLDKQQSVKWLTHSRWQLVLGRLQPGGGPMAPRPKPKLARFVLVFGMAMTILAILMWQSRDLAAPIPPTELIYRAQHLILY
jgi:hypothetical protein